LNSVYVGEAEQVITRFKQHHARPPFDWDIAIAFVSKEQSLEKEKLVATEKKKKTSDTDNFQGSKLYPLQEISGYMVRPGTFRMRGAYETANGVSFTIASHGATSAELLLFEPHTTEPKAIIPIPEEYRIGDTYSILVYGIKIEDFEYAYRFDGPNKPEKGVSFNKENAFSITSIAYGGSIYT